LQSEDHQYFALAEPIPGPTDGGFSAPGAGASGGDGCIAFRAPGAGVYHNTAVVIDADGTLLGRYRKMHIPDDPLFL
jgi:N-carbamoylputrescine amidase